MKTLILYIDALGYNFINEENTPFIYKYGKDNSLLKLKTLFGYTAIENTFITGRLPNETGIWTEFVLKKNYIGKILKLIPLSNNLLSYPYALLSYLKGHTFLSKLHNIPRKYFDKFTSSVTEGLWKREYFQNKKFVYYGWPFFVINNKTEIEFIKRSDDYKVKKFISYFNNDIDVYFIHTVDLDKTMHQYGTKSEETVKELKKQDNYVSLMVNEFESRFKDCKVIIWSDHGFMDIKDHINILDEIKNIKDLVYFIDSTMARFWVKEKNKKELIEKLSKIKNGHILTLEEKKNYNMPLSKEYGEIIFVADPGYLILPNFYQGNNPVKGMHGYMSDKDYLDAFLIINKKINKKVLNMHEVLPLIEDESIRV